MKTEDIQALVVEADKNIKTEQDLNAFKQMLTKVIVLGEIYKGLTCSGSDLI